MKGDERVRAEQELSKLRIIWSAFLMACALYALILYFVKMESPTLHPEILRWITVFAGVVAGMILLVVFVLKQMIVGLTGDDYRKFCIVRWAAVESISVLGLIQYFMGSPWYVGIAFIALSFTMLMTMAPSALEASDLQKNWR